MYKEVYEIGEYFVVSKELALEYGIVKQQNKISKRNLLNILHELLHIVINL